MKESMRRPSFSRMSSRRSSIDITPPPPTLRRGSDDASITSPSNVKDHDLRGPARFEKRPEPEPKTLRATAIQALRAWSPMPFFAAAKQSLSNLGDRFPRARSRTKAGRPLSVINELDEIIDAEARRRRTAVIGRNGFEYIVLKLWNVSTRLQNARWKLSGWRYHRSGSETKIPEDKSGSIIMIKEFVTQTERKAGSV